MRRARLGEMEVSYRKESYGDFVLVRPYGNREGAGYGEGDGTASGARLNGAVRWVTHPRRRSDGAMLPDAHGVIQTRDGALVMFSLHGRTIWVPTGGTTVDRQLLVTMF